jgi:hypothetical protein
MSQQKGKEAAALEARMMEQIRSTQKSHDALLQNFQGMISSADFDLSRIP